MDWSTIYPSMPVGARVEMADIGCGYGGLSIALAEAFPSTLVLGMEIRLKVTQYVHERIEALRARSSLYQNVGVIRANAMKFLPNFFSRGQLKEMFFLFPDPHFKRKKHKARIINSCLLAEYAYVLRPGGRLWTVTDVHDLHQWMVERLDAHPLFERIPDAELADDPIMTAVMERTEEGIKVTRNNGSKYPAVYRRIAID